MKSRLYFFLTSFFFGLLFIFFTYIVHKDKLTKFDFDSTIRIQDHLLDTLYPLFSSISFAASFEIVLIFLLLIVAILFFKRHFFTPLIVGIFGLGHLVELYGKVLIDHPSPPMKLVKQFDTAIFPQWYSQPISSYPSGHSFRVVFMAVIFIFLLFKITKFPKSIKLISSFCILLFVFAVSFSRIALGTHWTSDVIGGLLLGGNLGFLSLIFM